MLRPVFWLALVACLGGCERGPGLIRPDDPPGLGGGSVNGSGHVVTESRTIESFHRVAFTGVGRLVLEQTGSPSLSVIADDNIVPLLVSDVIDGTLTIGLARDTNLGRVRTIEFRVTAPALDELSATGAASVEARNIDTERLDVVVTGASAVVIEGRADEQDVTITGASAYNAAALASRVVAVDATGASSVVVRVNDTLTARVRGASAVAYIGSPTVHADGLPGSVYPQ